MFQTHAQKNRFNITVHEWNYFMTKQQRKNRLGLPIGVFSQKMLGTFNQYLPMLLSNTYWCQRKPTSLRFLFRVNRSTVG